MKTAHKLSKRFELPDLAIEADTLGIAVVVLTFIVCTVYSGFNIFFGFMSALIFGIPLAVIAVILFGVYELIRGTA